MLATHLLVSVRRTSGCIAFQNNTTEPGEWLADPNTCNRAEEILCKT